MRTKLSALLASVGVVLSGALISAHHAFSAEFDVKRPVKLEGTVTKMEWVNPHSWIHMDVTGPDGKTVRWKVEGGAPNALLRRGFSKESLPAGSKIVVEGYQAKDGTTRMNGGYLMFSDGKKLFMGSSGTGAPDEQPNK